MSAPLPDPVIVPDPGLEEFWEATARGVLLLARCAKCASVIWYPRSFCSACGSSEVQWFESSGLGTVYTFTVIRSAAGVFRDLTPYVVASVELDEGPRIMTNVVECDPDVLQIGQRVEVCFATSGLPSLFRFRPTMAEAPR